jgi:hypothetical protein
MLLIQLMSNQRRRVVVLCPYRTSAASQHFNDEIYYRACLRDSIEAGEAPLAAPILYLASGVLSTETLSNIDLSSEIAQSWYLTADACIVYTDHDLTLEMESIISKLQKENITIEYRKLHN